MKQKHWPYLLGIGAFFIIGWGMITFTQFRENVSTSLEGVHYILFLKTYPSKSPGETTLRRGDIVSIQGFEPAYVGEKPFTKRVLGLPGDLIVKDKKSVQLASSTRLFRTRGLKECIPKAFMSWRLRSQTRVPATFEPVTLPLLEKTSDGKPLTPISATSVPEGYVFVAGDHPNSFDSRYEEFGLVPIEKIWGKAVLCW